MNYYNKIKEKVIKIELYDKAKDYAKDRNKVIVYFEIGKLLSKAGKEYGKNIIKRYSEKLKQEVGKKYNERNLRYMRQLYEIIIKIKWNTLCSKLCWSHYREILSLKNENEIKYYLSECESNNLTQRQLHELIKQNTYNRLDEKTKKKIINNEQLKIDDLVPNPIIIKRESIDDKLSEYALRQLILNNIDLFLKQLGTGFSYIGTEYRIKIGNVYNYIDILLFNL